MRKSILEKQKKMKDKLTRELTMTETRLELAQAKHEKWEKTRFEQGQAKNAELEKTRLERERVKREEFGRNKT